MKVVLKLDFADDRIMQSLSGIPLHSDPKDKKMPVTGGIDVVSMVKKLRKLCHTEILSVTSEKKKDEPNKDNDPVQTPKANQPRFYNPYYFQSPYPQSQAAVPAVAYRDTNDETETRIFVSSSSFDDCN